MTDEGKPKVHGSNYRFYNWCITKNIKKDSNEEDEVLFIGDYVNGGHPTFAETKMKYIIWTLEKEENFHYHFYVEFTEKVSMKWIKENFDDKTLHCEPRRGTQQQAIDYVKKEGKDANKFDTKVYPEMPWFEWGEKKTPGNRNDLDSMVDMIEEGHTAGEVLMMFRGNALRHMGMIYRSIDALYGFSPQDKTLDLFSLEERRQSIRNRYNKINQENA